MRNISCLIHSVFLDKLFSREIKGGDTNVDPAAVRRQETQGGWGCDGAPQPVCAHSTGCTVRKLRPHQEEAKSTVGAAPPRYPRMQTLPRSGHFAPYPQCIPLLNCSRHLMGSEVSWEKESGFSPRKRGLASSGRVLPNPPSGPKVLPAMLANAMVWLIL